MTTHDDPRAQADDVGLLRPDTLADSVLMLVALTAAQRLIGFFRGILICRWLDPGELGQWEMAFSFITIAAPLAMLGVPGSFGRYVEYFSRRGQLKVFLRRTATFCLIALLAAVCLMLAGRRWLSELVFGSTAQQELTALIAVSLAGVIVFNVSMCLCTALRMYRVFTSLQLVTSVLFAAISVGLLLCWRMEAASVVVGYGSACLIGTVCVLFWLRGSWQTLPPSRGTLPQRQLWGKIFRFGIWIWLIELVGNVFGSVDRYMLIHHSGLPAVEALAVVGQYHSARVVPVLFTTLALLVGSMITPHLSRDWEAGRRDLVAQRLNLILKLVGLTLLACGLVVLLASPILFGWAFQHKFAAGLAVLPWTLTYCIWAGMAGVAQNYLWCAEKSWLGTLAILSGLITNVTLNLLLLPHFGLHGAIAATLTANLVSIVLVYSLARLLGMRMDRSTWLVTGAVASLSFGPWAAAGVLALAGVAVATTNLIFSGAEKHQLAEIAARYTWRLAAFRARVARGTGGAAHALPRRIEEGEAICLAPAEEQPC